MSNQMPSVRILVFGDSILKGVRYENGRYQVDHHWQQAFSEAFGVAVDNYSRFGNSIEKAMQGLRHICKSPAEGIHSVKDTKSRNPRLRYFQI